MRLLCIDMPQLLAVSIYVLGLSPGGQKTSEVYSLLMSVVWEASCCIMSGLDLLQGIHVHYQREWISGSKPQDS